MSRKKSGKSQKSLDPKIIAALRRVWRYHPIKAEVYKRNLVKKGLVKSNNIYKCELCIFKGLANFFNVDHVEPATELGGRKDWNSFIYRLLEKPLIDPDSCQLLCKPCHYKKTANENKIRKSLTKKLD